MIEYITSVPRMCARRWSGIYHLWLTTEVVVWRCVQRANICMCLSFFMLMVDFHNALPSHAPVCLQRKKVYVCSIGASQRSRAPHAITHTHAEFEIKLTWNSGDKNMEVPLAASAWDGMNTATCPILQPFRVFSLVNALKFCVVLMGFKAVFQAIFTH